MKALDVLEVLDLFEGSTARFAMDGGWGVDALLGEQTRSHSDLDGVIARRDVMEIESLLHPLGFEHVEEAHPGLPARYVMRDGNDRQVDLHVVVFDVSGNGWQELPNGGWGLYPAKELWSME
jgi:lincosamide nucleotidyltransferase A/C/D/E